MNAQKNTWTTAELIILKELNSPGRVQDYLDQIPYNSTTETRSPKWMMIKKRAHCVEGALFAAFCLRRLGHKPLVIDMRAVNDDDHVIAVYQKNHRWGAIAKSNFTTLRLREPVYKSIRELVMSYFDFYFNSLGEKTLRAYSTPLDLSRFDQQEWETTEADLEFISMHLDNMRHYNLLLPGQDKKLLKVSPYLIEAGMIGTNPDGLFKPKKS